MSGTQQLGEVCGPCFNPNNNDDCGECAEGLECVTDQQSYLIPDAPMRCKATSTHEAWYIVG